MSENALKNERLAEAPVVEIKLQYLPGEVMAMISVKDLLDRVVPLVADYLHSDNLVAEVGTSEDHDLIVVLKKRGSETIV